MQFIEFNNSYPDVAEALCRMFQVVDKMLIYLLAGSSVCPHPPPSLMSREQHALKRGSLDMVAEVIHLQK